MIDADPRDCEIPFLTLEESRQLRETAIDYEGVARDDWPEEQFRFISLFRVGFDAGLTPREVVNASPEWFNPKLERMTVPSRSRSSPCLNSTTWEYVDRWLTERETKDGYEETDAMWLTDDGEQYDQDLLEEHFARLCTEAGVSLEDRPLSWELLRTTIGVHAASEGGLRTVANQLGEKHRSDVLKYQPFTEPDHQEMRAALRRIG